MDIIAYCGAALLALALALALMYFFASRNPKPEDIPIEPTHAESDEDNSQDDDGDAFDEEQRLEQNQSPTVQISGATTPNTFETSVGDVTAQPTHAGATASQEAPEQLVSSTNEIDAKAEAPTETPTEPAPIVSVKQPSKKRAAKAKKAGQQRDSHGRFC